MFYPLIRQALFQLEPEKAHEFTFQQLKRITGTPLEFLVRQSVPTKAINCMGISFKNPLGLAAGFDKNGDYIDAIGAMGFGFIEVGTVTPHAQPGNKKPRLFRLVKAGGLINRMGCNNLGVDNLINNIKNSNFGGVLGINIGKNQDTPIEQGKDDYLICMEKVYPYADYIAINISSPNTPELTNLQFGELLDNLLFSIKDKQTALQEYHNKYVPIAVKITPDMTKSELIQMADMLVKHNIDGVIATNTTTNRELVHGLDHSSQAGGLSGRPIHLISTEVISILSSELKGKLPIIGVGGIDSLMAAREKMAAGAALIQIYSGLIFNGPRLIKDIISDI
ncbi:quinone-dependent dihydroorotate dehydrogenase [Candidatus Palibaumannia cicadellinicola]|uniref:Dihydroorotate dehydrogenase (quinone) n=1 Tax=Candidatus Palibaumannia cicadellinicola TaxID=186490 RepID=A0A0K2BKM9_9GAMM|nr:quinone-dependent dihydroorotate dehydrogenase [Candidatus Baumannia cicadellinicola]AKZ65951.1 Dihydroorotate dehydrogenase [Candidatus Baumannia cicadellinicola]